MPRSFKLILHASFREQALAIKKAYPKLEKPLVDALNEIVANPIPGTLQGITVPHLVGVIHKKHVGGNNGHRLIYLFFNKTDLVIPVFVSEVPKSRFSYDEIDWSAVCKPIYTDYKNKNYDAFTVHIPAKESTDSEK